MPRPLAECPSIGARERHMRNNEPVCGPCHDFFLEYLRERRKNPAKFQRGMCPKCKGGMNTSSGYDSCSKCRKKADPKIKPQPHGTTSGYLYHTRQLKEKACQACLDARNKDRREKRALKKKAHRTCINPGCTKRLLTKDDYCNRCKVQPLIGWQTVKGIKRPIYNVEGKHNVRKAG